MLLYVWNLVYTSFLRNWLKWILRKVTGKCELQRICSGHKPGAVRTTKIEYSLQASKSKVLRDSLRTQQDNVENSVEQIIRLKNIKTHLNPLFKRSLHDCLQQINGYHDLYAAVENLRKVPFSSENPKHETLLLKLWDLLMPEVKLETRITKQWGAIGFQGDDPGTDFRGMGLLGLKNLAFFSENYTQEARQVLAHSNHPTLGYSYAIVGINLTEMAYSLLKSDALKLHFYNTVHGPPELKHFHQVYCYLAYEFDHFWMSEQPETIMLFNQYKDKFHNSVLTLLKNPNVSLTLKSYSDSDA